jgi:hypothetical protein
MNSEDWTHKIFSDSELEELTLNYEKVVHDSENGIIINMGLSNEMCIDMIQAWNRGHEGHFVSQMQMIIFLGQLVEYLKSYLDDEGIDYS